MPSRCAVLSAASLAVCLVGCDPEGLGRSNPDFRVIGHRGAPNAAAENTMPSFEVAVALGANALELDVCVTEDDALVIWHDPDPDSAIALARQTGGEGLLYVPAVPAVGSVWRRPVSQLTFDELREHYGYAEFGMPRDESAVIPSLTEFLAWLRTEARLRTIYIDLKITPGQIETLLPVLPQLNGDSELSHVTFIIASTDWDVVRPLEDERQRLDAERVRVARDYEGPGALDGAVDAGLRDVMTGLVPSTTWGDFKKEIAEAVDARERGVIDSVTVWTFDREMQLAELLYYSVDGVITNEPARLHRMWKDTLD